MPTLRDEAQRCAELAAADQPIPPGRYVCRCDHDHAPGQTWCYLCEYPVERRLT